MGKKENTSVSGLEPSTDLGSTLEKLADIMLAKSSGQVTGGAPHVPKSAEEVAALPKMSQDEKAAEFYGSIKDLNDWPWPGIHVTSDNQVFIGHTQGENARDNHVAENKGMTFKSFPKPN